VWFPSNNLAFPKNLHRDTNTPSLEVITLYTYIPGHEKILLLLFACYWEGARPSYREKLSLMPQIRLANCFLAKEGIFTRREAG